MADILLWDKIDEAYKKAKEMIDAQYNPKNSKTREFNLQYMKYASAVGLLLAKYGADALTITAGLFSSPFIVTEDDPKDKKWQTFNQSWTLVRQKFYIFGRIYEYILSIKSMIYLIIYYTFYKKYSFRKKTGDE